MRPSFIVIVGLILALWLSAGRWLFGLGGSLTIWYLPTIGLVYLALHGWIANRVVATRKKGYKTSRGTRVSLIASWVTAVITGFLIPDWHEGALTSIASHYTGSDTALEMAIALSNTVGIISISLAGTAVGFAIWDSMDPRPEEVEHDGPIPVPKHPLA